MGGSLGDSGSNKSLGESGLGESGLGESGLGESGLGDSGFSYSTISSSIPFTCAFFNLINSFSSSLVISLSFNSCFSDDARIFFISPSK